MKPRNDSPEFSTPDHSLGPEHPEQSNAPKFFPLLASLWILAVLLVFLVIRVLDSNVAGRLLHKQGLF
jgi:hypothetical protein